MKQTIKITPKITPKVSPNIIPGIIPQKKTIILEKKPILTPKPKNRFA